MDTRKIFLIVIIAGALSVLAFLWMFKKQADEMKSISEKRMEEFKRVDASFERLKDSANDGLPGIIDTIK